MCVLQTMYMYIIKVPHVYTYPPTLSEVERARLIITTTTIIIIVVVVVLLLLIIIIIIIIIIT